MKIEGKYELLGLHKCLLEAKFNPSPNDFDIIGSPIASKLANQCAEELSELEDGWEEWRRVEGHPQLIENLLSALNKLNLDHVNSESRQQYIVDALSPLKVSKETILDLVSKVFDE